LQKIKRPKSIKSTKRDIEVGCGTLHVIMGSHEDKLIEVIATLGKSGGCASSQIEALGRSISLGLRWGIPVEDYIEQLKDIRCPNPVVGPGSSVCLSCSDGFSKALEEEIFEKTT